MQLGGAYAQPVGFAPWRVPTSRSVLISPRCKFVGILSRASFGLNAHLYDLHFLWGGWSWADLAASSCERHCDTKLGAGSDRLWSAIQRERPKLR